MPPPFRSQKASGTRWIFVSPINCLNGFKPATLFHFGSAVSNSTYASNALYFKGVRAI